MYVCINAFINFFFYFIQNFFIKTLKFETKASLIKTKRTIFSFLFIYVCILIDVFHMNIVKKDELKFFNLKTKIRRILQFFLHLFILDEL